MSIKFSISNDYGQLYQEVDLDLTPEEMLDIFWIVMVTIHQLDINEVRLNIELLRQTSRYVVFEKEESVNV